MKKTMANEQEAGTSDGAKKGWETRKGGASSSNRDQARAAKRSADLFKSDLAHVAFKKRSNAISKGIANAKARRVDSAWADGLAKARSQARKNKGFENELEVSQIEEMKMKREEEKKESMVAADEADMPEAKQEAIDPEQDADHEDVAKDKELILSMIKKYMGKDDEEMGDEEMEAAHEAYEAYCEMGEEEDEAMKCAAKAMKLAKHMAEKKVKAAEGEKCEDEKEEEAKHSEVVPMEPKADPEKGAEAKESEVKLAARIAFLEGELKKHDLAAVLDKKLKESGLARAATDKIRECIGTPKSEAHIIETIKIFKEAFAVRGGESVAKDASFFVTTERKEVGAVDTKVDFSKF